MENNLEKDDEEQKEINLVEFENGNPTLIFILITIAAILIVLIIILLFILKKQKRR